MEAFIYAAGRALRLGPSYSERPKILIEFGGRSLLEWHVLRLSEAGIKKLHVIVGHRREMIEETFPVLRDRYRVQINGIINADYTEGSVLSMHVSVPSLAKATPPVFIMDGDVLYPPELFKRLVDSKHSTVMLIDRNYSTADDDPVLVPIRQKKPVEFMKKWQGTADFVGESIGFFKMAAADVALMIKETNARTEGERRRDSYDDVLRALVLAGRIDYEDVTGIPWTEIDFPSDI